MASATYTEQPCKTALNRVHGMPFKWSLNPYRGCVHACHYCYARATHAYFGLNAGEDFETQIFVKANIAEVLRKELARPSWTGDRVSIGTATDPYQPCEGRFRLTRQCLEVLHERGNGLSIVTKSTLVLRDRNLLAAIARQAEVTVYFTVTTLDPGLWRLVEPGTPPPLKRLEVMRRLVDAGVPAGVLLAPVLPGLTDSVASIDAVASAAWRHGATSLGTGVLRLAPLVREHYLGFVAATFPDLLPRYERAYVGVNASRDYLAAVQARIDRIGSRHGFGADTMRQDRVTRSLREPEKSPQPPQRQLPLLL